MWMIFWAVFFFIVAGGLFVTIWSMVGGDS